jgi:hypothetical protein
LLVQGSNNQFVNNAVGASNVPPQGTLNLSCNWWGSAFGPARPANPANPLGTGNLATVNTTFTNWSTDNIAFACNGNPQNNEILARRVVPTMPFLAGVLFAVALLLVARRRIPLMVRK